MGRKVYEFLVEKFPYWASEELTRQLEEAMDKIESGEIDYIEVLKEVHKIKNLDERAGESTLVLLSSVFYTVYFFHKLLYSKG
ncbi:MAG TPA: hypothetical protein EYH58_05070 [Aquifex aeolicus]|nr:hypothetical protein [Aquifex aeolicus]